jgi:hypothetical protein
MAATVTLSTTTLAQQVSASDTIFKLASTSGLIPGVRLYLDRELVTVVDINPDSSVDVARGVDGSAGSAHAYGSIVTIGRADQFYSSDPIGLPPNELPVSPWINVLTGAVWTAVGDESGSGLGARLWAQQTTTSTVGALGVRVTTTA